MKQFKTILKFELLNYLKNKVFVGITLFLIIAIAAVTFIPNIINAIEANSDETSAEPLPVMIIKAENDTLAEISKHYFKEAFPDYAVELSDDSIEKIKTGIEEGVVACAFVLESASAYKYYVNNLSMYDVNVEIANEALVAIRRIELMTSEGLSEDAITSILNVQIQNETVNLGKNQIDNFFYTYIMILALYMVILLYGQMVATNVATEKSSRAMELLITSANPISMMFGKVIASCLAGLFQLTGIFGTAILFYKINENAWGGNPIISSIFNIPPELLIYMLVFFLLGFLIYAFLYGAIASTASKLEDINTSVMPLTFLFIISFMVVMFSMSSGAIDNAAMKICSYVPFTSPMAMFARIAMSTVPIYEILISIFVLIASVIGIGFLSAKIYRAGVLLYGTKPNIFEILKSVFKA